MVQVAYARDPVEAALIEGLLEDAGIPCFLQPSGMNVADGPQLGFGMLARGFGGGPQSVMVPADRADAASELLAERLVEAEAEALPGGSRAEYPLGRSGPRNYGALGAYARAIFLSLAAFAVAFGLFLLLRAA